MRRHSHWLLLLVAVSGFACTQEPSGEGMPSCSDLRAAAVASDANVVLIVNDTMRRDHMGAYGGTAKTPAFDAFAKDNLLFDHAYTQAVWTKPSVATLFTSLYPSQHRVESDPQIRNPLNSQRTGTLMETDILSSKLTTLAEVMKGAGYATAAFVANPWLEKRFGFDQGFDVYDDSFAQWGIRGDVVSQAGLNWLQRQPPGHKFFLYLHYLDSHLPYGVLDRTEVERHAQELAADRRPLNDQAMMAVRVVARFPDGVSALALGYRPALGFVEMAYDSGIAAFDQWLGLFLRGFAQHWAAEKTVIIVTSDHGEALYERGYGNHGTGLFDDEVAIPFAARFPAVQAADHRVACPVGLIDVMPTLCTYLGVRCPDTMFGASFITRADDREPQRTRRYLVTEGVAKRPQHRAIRNRDYKLLWENGPRGDGQTKADPYSLYDVGKDPQEHRDLRLAENRSPDSDRVFQTMAAALRDAVPPFASPDTEHAPVDPATRERLRQLGYAE
jgi:choline-sulfatase